MTLKSIKLCNFKSIKKLDIEFNKINVFYGLNGSGKSSILEALALFVESINTEPGNLVGDGRINSQKFYRYKAKKFENLIYKGEREREIIIEVDSVIDNRYPISYSAKYKLSDEKYLTIKHVLKYEDTIIREENYGLKSVLSDDILNEIEGSYSQEHKQYFKEFKNLLLNTRFMSIVAEDVPDFISVVNIHENETIASIVKYCILPNDISWLVERTNKFKFSFGNIENIWGGWVGGDEIECKVKYSDKVINLGSEGFGFKRLLEILLALDNIKYKANDGNGGIFLLEEPEICISMDNLQVLSKIINECAKGNNIQFLITTHNPLLLKEFEPEHTSIFHVKKGENGSTTVDKFKEFNSNMKEEINNAYNKITKLLPNVYDLR